VCASIIAAGALIWLAFLPAHAGYLLHIFGPLVISGIGIGMSFVPMTLAATTGVPPHQAGLASGLINTTRQMGGAVGLAAMATVAASTASHRSRGLATLDTALTAGYDRAFLIAGGALVLGAILALLIPKSPQNPPSITGEHGAGERSVAVET
jgi:MFS family permease